MSGGLSARGIAKSFGETHALRGVDLDAPFGQITAVIGQNGAGKSTLMGVLSGTVDPDAGTLHFPDPSTPFRPTSPLDARRHGVAMVHQELSLCPHLSVRENLFLGELPTRFGIVDWRRASELSREALAPLEGDEKIDPRAIVGELSIANAQIVEIARAIGSPDAKSTEGDTKKILILDEPTSSLGRADVARLFDRLRAMRDRGYAILYISHFLEEVKAISDRFVVLRDGKTVGGGDTASTSIEAMVEAMAGRAIESLYPRSERPVGDVVLETKALVGSHPPSAREDARGSTLELRRGEVVGIAGLLGAGRTELLRAIFGLDPVTRGTLRVFGREGSRSPHARWAARVGFASEDRKEEGLATSLSVAANLTLSHKPSFFIGPGTEARAAAKWIDALSIKTKGPDQRTEDLSGGNQQKVALARILHHGAEILLLDEPTRGIDVESKAQIYSLIDAEARAGRAILVVSSYLPELLGICDRVHVMRRGVLGPSIDARGATEESLLAEATAS
ncbi:MAG: sugar ABC transporter ATP-binding protein [Polyangiaceae bacterium]